MHDALQGPSRPRWLCPDFLPIRTLTALFLELPAARHAADRRLPCMQNLATAPCLERGGWTCHRPRRLGRRTSSHLRPWRFGSLRGCMVVPREAWIEGWRLCRGTRVSCHPRVNRVPCRLECVLLAAVQEALGRMQHLLVHSVWLRPPCRTRHRTFWAGAGVRLHRASHGPRGRDFHSDRA